MDHDVRQPGYHILGGLLSGAAVARRGAVRPLCHGDIVLPVRLKCFRFTCCCVDSYRT